MKATLLLLLACSAALAQPQPPNTATNLPSAAEPPTAGRVVTVAVDPSPDTNINFYAYSWQVTIPPSATNRVLFTINGSNVTARILLPLEGRNWLGATAVDADGVESEMVVLSNRWPLAYSGELISMGSATIDGVRTSFMTNQIILDSPVNFLWQELRKVIIP